MSSSDGITISLGDEAATTQLANVLAPLLSPGDVVAIIGELGAGKTSLARGIIRAIAGNAIEVPSPTFTLVQEYRDLDVPVVHYDLYRLRSEDELVEIGFGEADRDALALVEWAERAGQWLPAGALTISMKVVGDGRQVTVNGPEPILDALREAGV